MPERRSSALTRAQERARAEGLGQVVVGAELERPHQVFLFAARRQHHDRHGRAAADVLADVEAAARGQVDVENDEIRKFRVEDAQRLGGVARLDDGIAGIRQRERDERGQVRIVVDHQELHEASATSGSVTVNRVSPCRRPRRADFTAVALDDGLHDPEAEAEAFRVRLLVRGAVEALEDRGALELRRAGPGIRDPQLDLLPRDRGGADRDLAVLGAELARIGEEVRDDLREPRRIARDRGQVFRQRHAQHLAPLREQPADEILGVLHDLGERDRLAPDAELAGLDADALQQVVDEAREAQRPALQRFEQVPEPFARHGVETVQHQLHRGELRRERRPEFMRDVREHGVARTAHGLELGLVAQDLHLQARARRGARDDDGSRRAARLEVFRRLRLAVVARRVDRAAEVAGTPAIHVARFQHVAAELADEVGRGRAEHFRGLRVQVTDAPVGIHRIDALDHALQHGLGLGLAMAQRRRQVHEVASHVFHRAGERLDFLRALGRDRGGEIALAEPLRGGGQRLERRADPAREDERNEERNEGEQERDECEPAHEARNRARDLLGGSRASMRRMASPVEAKSGRLAANWLRAGIGATAMSPVASASECMSR